MPAKAEVKYGFYLGIGAFIAFAVLAFLQALTLRALHSSRG
jgi:hypothetical protein